MSRDDFKVCRLRCHWLLLMLLSALLPLAIGVALLAAMPAQGAAPEPPQPPPVALSTYAGQEVADDGRPIHAQLTVGLLSAKPEDVELANYCPPDDTIEAAPGEMLVFCYQMHNQSDIYFTRHTVVDDIFKIILENASLLVSPTVTVQAVVPIAASVTRTNAMTWTAYAENGDSATAFDNATVFVPTLVVTATVGQTPGVCANTSLLNLPDADEVTYCFRAHNPTPYALIAHRASDGRGNPLALPDDLILAPGATYTLTTTAAVTAPVQESITWTARTATRQLPVTATAAAAVRTPHVDVQLAFARVGAVCRSGDLAVVANTLVRLCYTAVNDGSMPVYLHRVIDPAVALDFAFPTRLEPDAAIGIVITRLVTVTTATQTTWYATLDDGRVISDTAQGRIDVVPPGDIAVTVLLTDAAGAIGVPGIGIELVAPDGIQQSHTTNALGQVHFTDLVPGLYTTRVATATLGSGLGLLSPDTITISLTARSVVSVDYALTGTLPLQRLHLPIITR